MVIICSGVSINFNALSLLLRCFSSRRPDTPFIIPLSAMEIGHIYPQIVASALINASTGFAFPPRLRSSWRISIADSKHANPASQAHQCLSGSMLLDVHQWRLTCATTYLAVATCYSGLFYLTQKTTAATRYSQIRLRICVPVALKGIETTSITCPSTNEHILSCARRI